MPEITNVTNVRPPRVSSYQARIERTLTDIYHEVPPISQAGQEWILEAVGHTNGYASCELCGHFPIKRLFWIRNCTTQDQRMIGSECARNYVRVDLVDAYMRTIQREQNRTRTATRRRERRNTYMQNRSNLEAQREQERVAWRETNADLILWLSVDSSCPNSNFLADMVTSLRRFGSLTENQTAAVRRVMAERASRTTTRPQNALDRAASPDQVPHIYNGTYTMDDGSQHMTFQIYTATRGALQGKRIVKKQNQYMRFEGFAFVGQDGSLVVWRRYREAEERHERFIMWARDLLSVLAERTTDAVGIDSLTGAGWTIQRTRACRRCNRALTVPTSIESGIGPECQRRDHERTAAAPHHESVGVANVAASTVHESQADRVFNIARGGGIGCYPPVTTTANNTTQRVQVPVRTEQLALSELGTGEVQ